MFIWKAPRKAPVLTLEACSNIQEKLYNFTRSVLNFPARFHEHFIESSDSSPCRKHLLHLKTQTPSNLTSRSFCFQVGGAHPIPGEGDRRLRAQAHAGADDDRVQVEHRLASLDNRSKIGLISYTQKRFPTFFLSEVPTFDISQCLLYLCLCWHQ